MNLIIYANEHYEEERALFNLETNEVILKGDYYHDKIYEKIEGYLLALKDFNIYIDKVISNGIDRSHAHYDLCEFYDEEEE